MGINSGIQWTHHTFNPWWGCTKVSEACRRCYAESFAKRTGNKVWGDNAERRLFGDAHWREPVRWNAMAEKAGERVRVFCASMSDVFEDRRDLDQQRERLWRLIEATTHLDWLLLTKRSGAMVRLAPKAWADEWPSNVWAGSTVEDQPSADARIAHLVRVPARIRFLSMEPLVGPVSLPAFAVGLIHWVIIGGESGAGARRLDFANVERVLAWAKAHGAAPFVKQLGQAWAQEDKSNRRDSHGGEPSEWPEHLRVREFPNERR
jgi:protein gp37